MTVSCGAPPLPLNGRISHYFNTVEGANVTILCTHPSLSNSPVTVTAVCNQQGQWEPDPANLCTLLTSGIYEKEGKITNFLYINL